MAIIPGILPPSRENWELLVYAWQFFPLFSSFQWVTDWYPMGKTSIDSKFNIPGKIGWATMEAPGFITLLYIMFTMPKDLGIEQLPNTNWLMASLFVIHYLYRAIVAPLFLNPTMSPMHPFVWASALSFQLINATCIGGWLAGYGPTSVYDWQGQMVNTQVGLMLWGLGLFGNFLHDDELRDIRRTVIKQQKEDSKKNSKAEAKGADKVYMMPRNLLFEYCLYPHYFCEWIEWAGFWVIGGWRCVPARSFLLNEIFTMTPRALAGRRWYVQRFGEKEVGNKKAVIPGIL